MPNSGFHGQINQSFEGVSKEGSFPLGSSHADRNLPNPAFWDIFVKSTSSKPTSFTAGEGRLPIGTFSRHMLSQPMHDTSADGDSPASSLQSTPEPPQPSPYPTIRGGIINNSVAPFSTLAKPTCGYFFSRLTDHKKRRTGILPADIVQWRYFVK